ncbi:MAG: hypothetical protein ACI87W_003636 [Halieaceae bacterium]|jgi:hypothetical protein
MDIFELLMMGVEVSIALAGFAGIIATFQFTGSENINRGRVGALTVIVQFSLFPALACSLALCLKTFEVSGEQLWVVCSWFGAAIYSYAMYGTAKAMRGALTTTASRMIFVVLQGVGVLIIGLNVFNALGIVFQNEPGPYIVGVLYGLAVASFMFARLLLRPLWRAVRLQEGG